MSSTAKSEAQLLSHLHFAELPEGASSVFARRFRQARVRAKMTQEQVAAGAGIDEYTASARMSQYERAVHIPRYQIAINLAAVLGVPVEFLYSPDDPTAELLLMWHGLSKQKRARLLDSLRSEM